MSAPATLGDPGDSFVRAYLHALRERLQAEDRAAAVVKRVQAAAAALENWKLLALGQEVPGSGVRNMGQLDLPAGEELTRAMNAWR